MSAKTKIEWCDATWNPVQGCDPISPGCKNCYARRIAERFRGTKNHPYEYGFDVRWFLRRLDIPSQWKKPRNIFVCSMSDLFHDKVPDYIIDDVFKEMLANPHHVFFVLTKRPERMARYISSLKIFIPYPGVMNHIWFGVSVEDEPRMERLKVLAGIEGINRFVSFEPLIGRIHLEGWEDYLSRMGWIICGGETGPNARNISVSTVSELEKFTHERHIPFFFKKWGNGQDNRSLPREFPVFRKAADGVGEKPVGNPHNSLENVKAPWGKTLADGKEKS